MWGTVRAGHRAATVRAGDVTASGMFTPECVRVLGLAVSAGARRKSAEAQVITASRQFEPVPSLRFEASGLQHRRQRRPYTAFKSKRRSLGTTAEMEGDHQPEAEGPHEPSDSPEVQRSLDHCDVLLQSLNRLRRSGLFCDVVLVAGGVRFFAHRPILSVCSDYFKSMFAIGTREYYQDEVELVGVSSVGFKGVLDFIYNNGLVLHSASILCVLKTACVLQVWGLVDECRKYLENTTPDWNSLNRQRFQELISSYSLERLNRGG